MTIYTSVKSESNGHPWIDTIQEDDVFEIPMEKCYIVAETLILNGIVELDGILGVF